MIWWARAEKSRRISDDWPMALIESWSMTIPPLRKTRLWGSMVTITALWSIIHELTFASSIINLSHQLCRFSVLICSPIYIKLKSSIKRCLKKLFKCWIKVIKGMTVMSRVRGSDFLSSMLFSFLPFPRWRYERKL